MRRAPVARPLDDRNWLVLPFDNIARDPALEMVRDASVTLLYSAMSQWEDLRVVDDTRVADLMRGVPAGVRLGQEAGFELARHVGAGKLVMGTLLKEGTRTRAMAAVFDVRSGRRLRTPTVAMAGTDSLMSDFARLSEQVLAVPAPPGVRLADVGTKNSEALREYVAGLGAELRWVSDTAVMHFRRAVAIDSTFGLAHYHIATNLWYWRAYWDVVTLPGVDSAEEGRALAAAQRFAAGMPRRERAQVAASNARRWPAICALVDRMVAQDSLDAWALWMHGRCRLHVLQNDSVSWRARFAVDNARLADWRRATELDPTLPTPVDRALRQLTVTQRWECVHYSPAGCPASEVYTSALLLDHDTLVYRPYLLAGERRDRWALEPGQFASFRRARELARDWLAAFVAVNPGNWGGHFWLSSMLRNLGDLDGALRELDAASGATRFPGVRRQFYLRRSEIALRQENPLEAVRYIDSVYADRTAGQQPQVGSIFGRYALEAAIRHPGNDSLRLWRQALLSLYAGVLPGDLDRVARRYADAIAIDATREASQQARVRRAVGEVVTLLAFRMRHTRPAADTADPHPIIRSQAWFALGDTARSRRELRTAEEEVDRRPVWAWDDGSWLFAAEGCLLLGDSAAALRRMRDLATRWRSMASDIGQLLAVPSFVAGLGNSPARAVGREWLLYGDLAAAAGDAEQARRAYRFVVGLWEGGEAPVQPLVARARAALAQLGN